ncbi:MAG: hypothetical protein GY774_26010 [Planctomycetes bacterium]|nr:hypothetical protein [Planctomycetota bacterium]
MIRTLRITSILAVALAAALVVFSVVFGVRGDKGIEELLGEPNVIEKFNTSAGNKTTRSTNQVSPLVQQAGAFALCLNPPKPKPPRSVKNRVTGATRTPSATPKFKVVATSYHKDRPEMSIAMIDEPGKGRSWVRQSGTVGHLFIVEIKDGVVVVKDSSGTFELAAEQKPHVSLLEGAPVVGSKGAGISSTAAKTGSKPSAAAPAKSSRYSGKAVSRTPKLPRTPVPRKTKVQESAVMKEVSAKFAELRRKLQSDKTGTALSKEQRDALMNKTLEDIIDLKSKDISKDENDRLSIIGEQLKKMMEQPTSSGKK